jgi:hypothetical protein
MIFFTADAVADSNRLYEFLEPKNPGAAARAMRAIWTKLELVERMPGLGLKTKSPRVRQVHGTTRASNLAWTRGAQVVRSRRYAGI